MQSLRLGKPLHHIIQASPPGHHYLALIELGYRLYHPNKHTTITEIQRLDQKGAKWEMFSTEQKECLLDKLLYFQKYDCIEYLKILQEQHLLEKHALEKQSEFPKNYKKRF